MSRELEFERPVLELERQIEELRRLAAGRDQLAATVADEGRLKKKKKADGTSMMQLESQILRLEEQALTLKGQIFSRLSRWQIVQVARHPQRPYTLDYLQSAFADFVELHGDRNFGDDPAIVCGLAKLKGESVMVIGHQKGRTTAENLRRNFGMPRPEGYRKALRAMRVAERFGLPIVTLIDTPGAYPGIGAEERGQAQAIAECLEGMAALKVPVVSVVIGEGGSGGALAIGVANRVLMLEFSIYSVISPEGCASILWKSADRAREAADALGITSARLLQLGLVDQVLDEPLGGAHRDAAAMAATLKDHLLRQLDGLERIEAGSLVEARYRRLRGYGSQRVE